MLPSAFGLQLMPNLPLLRRCVSSPTQTSSVPAPWVTPAPCSAVAFGFAGGSELGGIFGRGREEAEVGLGWSTAAPRSRCIRRRLACAQHARAACAKGRRARAGGRRLNESLGLRGAATLARAAWLEGAAGGVKMGSQLDMKSACQGHRGQRFAVLCSKAHRARVCLQPPLSWESAVLRDRRSCCRHMSGSPQSPLAAVFCPSAPPRRAMAKRAQHRLRRAGFAGLPACCCVGRHTIPGG